MAKVGIKETSEALAGTLALAAVMVELMKDGVQMSDATALMLKFQSDEKFKKALEDAYAGVNQVPAEMADLDLMEGLALAGVAAPGVKAILEAMQKPKAA